MKAVLLSLGNLVFKQGLLDKWPLIFVAAQKKISIASTRKLELGEIGRNPAGIRILRRPKRRLRRFQSLNWNSNCDPGGHRVTGKEQIAFVNRLENLRIPYVTRSKAQPVDKRLQARRPQALRTA